MVQGPILLVILLLGIGFIVLSTSKWKLHPFISLLIAAYGIAFAAGMPVLKIGQTIRNGFGGILNYIGIVIILGTIIGTILEKSGAAITMADTVLKVVGEKRPGLAMSIIGYIVSIPVFCDSGYVILSSLKKSLAKRTKSSAVMMSVALATGLYATHTLVPPTPGPIAAAGNLGLENSLGLVIIVGLIVSIITMLAGYFWATLCGKKYKSAEDLEELTISYEDVKKQYGNLPSPSKAFAPIIVPIVLITLGSIANFPTHPFGEGTLFTIFSFLGKPINALFIGFFFALSLLPKLDEETLSGWIGEGLKSAAIIIMVTGAGGALGQVLKSTPIGNYLGTTLAKYHLGIFLPFIIAAALKTAQGSSTVALVTTSALVAPLLSTLGLASEMGRVLTVMAIGAGAMTVSHANDSFFWVVTQFSGMDVSTAYKSQTLATLVQGLVTITVVSILSFILI
ncbi:gluconate transporter [Caloranaerobacter azorensis H53214]|uniref:Predicted D-glycerate permease n=2 Tax=Caloranaerobacter azorensis TaxID=116090 RepID=A0A1M5V8B2_9FIRM|nr:GntP family permease [Caloranaerobacter azorensis]KGG81173.1 gluconate transporter [Caloranaerobacter azorensis H53214]SHH71324.1 predicted D-glycerate permease [Caloranaerobacter azorensis DSM 13643]